MKQAMKILTKEVQEGFELGQADSVETKRSTPSDNLDISQYRIDLTIQIEEPHPLIEIDGITAISPDSIVVIKAASKSGKSFVSSSLAAAFIHPGIEVLKFKASPLAGRTKVVYLDTEQSLAHVHKLARRVHRLAELEIDKNVPNFEIYYLKELDTAQKHEALIKTASDPQVGLIILDGIVDIVYDFNDLKEATRMRDLLMQLVSKNKVALIAVIHTNKHDANSRGHWGGILEQKSETTFQITKQDGIFTVTPAYTRNAPFDEFQFIINFEGIPELVNEKVDRAAKAIFKKRNDLTFVLSGQKRLKYEMLVLEYSQIASTSERTAKRHISEALRSSWIMKDNTGNYLLSNQEMYGK
jgi:hypothetical protein